MSLSYSDLNLKGKETVKIKPTLFFLGIFSIYLLLRCFAWKNTNLLEGADSAFYLNNIKTYLTFNLQNIINLPPLSTPFYPFFGALCSLPGWSVETGARLCSLLFSSLLFIAIFGIGKQIAKPLEVALGLLILSFNTALISHSFSVMLEPSYIATIYFGFWVFLTQHKEPKLRKAALLGVIFGLSFLNRPEGIIYLAILPFFQGVYIFFWEQKYYKLKRFIVWSLLFVTFFSLMAIPQIWHVSNKMGHLAVNGKQVWPLILYNPDLKSNNEKIYGLDFSPKHINLYYVMYNPELQKQFAGNVSKTIYVKHFIFHFYDFCRSKLWIMIGLLGFVFFCSGLLALYRTGRRYEAFVILAFVCLNLVAPLLTQTVRIKYILIIAPMIILVEGIGIVYLSRSLLLGYKNRSLEKHVLPFLLLFVLIVTSVFPLVKALRPPHFNKEYAPVELKEPIAIIKKIVKNELLSSVIITARKPYLTYFAHGRQIYLPYTTYESLVKYCDLNNVDFLYLKHNLVKEYPFYETFLEDKPPVDFVLLYSGIDSLGEKIELYRFGKQVAVSS